MTRREAYAEAKNRDRTGHTNHVVRKAKKPILDDNCNVIYEDVFVLVLKSYTA